MEIPRLNSDDTESLSDTTKKKEKKAKKAASFIHVPVPIQIEAARNVPPEAERAMAELGDDDKTKKRKKTKKKVGHTLLSDTETAEPLISAAVAEQAQERRIIEQEELEEDEEDEDDEDAEKEAGSTTPEVKKSAKDKEFHGELLISDRARRLRELEEQALAEAAAELDSDITEEESDRALLEQIAEEMAALDDEALEPVISTEDEPDDTTTAPASTTPRTSSTSTTTPPPPPAPVSTSTPVPPVPFTAPAAGGGTIPPVPFMATGGAPIYPTTPNVLAAPTSVAPVEVASTRNAERRGLLTGLLVGGLIEHVRHKRRERRMDKEHTEAIKGMGAEQQAAALQAAEKEKTASRKHTALETQLTRLKEQATRIVPEQQSASESPAERPQPVSTSERFQPANSEQTVPMATKEKSPEEVAKARVALEQAWAAEQEAFEKQREVPDDRRIESSAWHSIEVDKKTGKAVEDPALAYGEEFKYEQHQEQLRRDVEDASIESASMRERYVDPHIQRPSEQEYASMGSSPQSYTQARVDKKEKKYEDDKDSGIEVVDIILWGILIVVVVIIFRVLSS